MNLRHWNLEDRIKKNITATARVGYQFLCMSEKISNFRWRIKKNFMGKYSSHIQCIIFFIRNGNADWSSSLLVSAVMYFFRHSSPFCTKITPSFPQKRNLYYLLYDSCWRLFLYICPKRMRNHQNWPKLKFDILIVCVDVFIFLSLAFLCVYYVYFHYSISKENGSHEHR